MARRIAFVCMLALLSSLTPIGGASAAVPGRPWHPCFGEISSRLRCRTVRVPLDHDDPSGPTIALSLVKLPASDPDRRIGSIFLNPGGPGGSGVDMVAFAGRYLFSGEVRARFDLVGFDPRGIARSAPLRCFDSLKQGFKVLPPFGFPLTPEEEGLVARLDARFEGYCDENAGPIRDHMATADVARDLDALRRAVGDPQLTFVGYSYGSFLGVTYANMFPNRVRAVVVDGVLDPVAWTTGRGDEADTLPFSTRLRSDQGAMDTLEEFFRLCDEAGRRTCAFAGHSADRYAALAERLKAEPIDLDGFSITYADLVDGTLGAMYDSGSWPSLAQALHDLESLSDGAATSLRELRDVLAPDLAADYPNFIEGFPGVACSDSDNPDGHDAWAAAAAAADTEFGYFGRPWTWRTSVCAVWGGFDEDRYLGPFDHATANPVLVVGTRFDPATRYEGAVIVDDLLPSSSLLTVEGWGHTSLFLSACANRVVNRYLLYLETPAPGATCFQDWSPFPTGSGPDDGTAARMAARAAVLRQIAPYGLLLGTGA